MTRGSRNRSGRSGFSLLELTLVIAIMGVLMAVAAVAFGPKLLRAKKSATVATMKTVKQELTAYEGDNNAFPAALAMLAPNYLEKAPIDGWGREFYYKVPGTGGRPYDLISRGEDGQLDTPDDLNVWTIDEKR